MKKRYRESTRMAKEKRLLYMSIFHDADVSGHSVKRLQTAKQTAVEYFPNLTTVVLSLSQKDKSFP
jgi:hypothetical protein